MKAVAQHLQNLYRENFLEDKNKLIKFMKNIQGEFTNILEDYWTEKVQPEVFWFVFVQYLFTNMKFTNTGLSRLSLKTIKVQRKLQFK